jgi:hypothetical protein
MAALRVWWAASISTRATSTSLNNLIHLSRLISTLIVPCEFVTRAFIIFLRFTRIVIGTSHQLCLLLLTFCRGWGCQWAVHVVLERLFAMIFSYLFGHFLNLLHAFQVSIYCLSVNRVDFFFFALKSLCQGIQRLHLPKDFYDVPNFSIPRGSQAPITCCYRAHIELLVAFSASRERFCSFLNGHLSSKALQTI